MDILDIRKLRRPEQGAKIKVKDVGERSLISAIHRLQAIVPMGYVGIGDDAAYLPPSSAGWLISQDMLVEDVHFRWADGWRSPFPPDIRKQFQI